MRKLVIFGLLASIIFAQQRTSYSWEDGSGTILGTFCYGSCDGVNDAENVGSTSGISPHNGSRMLTVSDPCIDANPEAYIAWVTNLSVGNEISACFWGYDNTPGSKPSLRIWGNWSENDDITSYTGSASGNSDYTDGLGWGQVCHTWTVTEAEDEGLVIKARVYSEDDDLPQEYFIDLVEVTAPGGATVHYPGTAAGCTDDTACNYNPFASAEDGSCVYPEGSISIYDIQYTSNQGEYCYESVHDQECWTTSGTVSAKFAEYSKFYLQDESSSSYAGIYVHGYSATLPTLGQNIDIIATVNEYYSLTQLIDGASFSVNSSGNYVEPTNISTGDLTGCTASGEAVESMLVRINNVSVTTTSNEYGEWYVDDGSGPVMINDNIFDGEEWLDPSSCQQFESIVGVVDYAYSEFSILPRTMSDLVVHPDYPVAVAGEAQFVAPGTPNVTLNASQSEDPDGGTIIDWEWTQMAGPAVTLSPDENAEIVTFTAPSTEGELLFKLTVWNDDFNENCDWITVTVGTGLFIMDIQCPDGLEQGTYCYETPLAGDEDACEEAGGNWDGTGCIVAISGVVTHVLPAGHASAGTFFLQQQFLSDCGGIYIFDSFIDPTPSQGDLLSVTGTLNEYYSFTQLTDITTWSLSSEGNAVSPSIITTAELGIECSLSGEQLEGMLVKVFDATVEGIDEFGNVQINDGSGPTLMDDYYFDGVWSTPEVGEIYPSIVGVVGYSYSEFKIYPRNDDDFVPCVLGDPNYDNFFNVQDIVILAGCILAVSCDDLEYSCAADLNGDGFYNVVDIVILANCILAQTCADRVDNATESHLIMNGNIVSIKADGFIGGVQMTLTHGDDFTIDMTDQALFADYSTEGNETRLLVITPETEDLFSYSGNFEISEIIVANTHAEIPTSLPVLYSLSSAYPNPFNPVTTMEFTISEAGNVNVQVYNLQGKVVSTLLSGHQVADSYNLTWDASQSPSGIYFVKAKSAEYIQTQKLMLIK